MIAERIAYYVAAQSRIFYHMTPARNVARILREGLVPRRGPRSRAMKEKYPAIYLFPDLATAEHAYSDWMEREFGEDTVLSLLRVTLPPGIKVHSDAGFERHIYAAVPPENIRLLARDVGAETSLRRFETDASARLYLHYWYHPKDNVTLDAARYNHAEMVAKFPSKFGISPQEAAELRKHPDFEMDWNSPAIRLANDKGWVRVKIEGPPQTVELSLQSHNARDLHKAARHFVDRYAPMVVYIDHELRDYDKFWHAKLEGDSLERYLKTGKLPRERVGV